MLNETAIALEDEAIHIAQIKAQRLEIKPKIALATEESVRAYTIWHLFKHDDEVHAYPPHKKSPNTVLSNLLLAPILDTFNMGFPEDVELIKTRLSKPWIELDGHNTGLQDKKLPGYLILMCMIDTVVVMTYALAHREAPKKTGYLAYGSALVGNGTEHGSRVVTKEELSKACDWYTNTKDNKQEQLHKTIRDLVDEEGEPKDSHSITNIQMKIIETVELFSDTAETASGSKGVLASASQWWSGGKK